jgi:CRP-like cAMP-binding protein
VPADLLPADEGQRELDVRVRLGLAGTDDQLAALLAIARQIDVPAGHVLYKRDDPASHGYELIAGEIELGAPGEPPWRVVEGGAIGFIDLLLGRTHARTAVTTSAARLLELDAADFREYLEDQFEVSYHMLVRLSTQLTTSLIALGEPFPLLAPRPASRTRSFADIEIPIVERLTMLARMPLFRGGSMQGIANLAQSATEVRFAPGDVIAAAGDRPTVISFLVEGTVELAFPTGARVLRTGRELLAHVEELAPAPRRTTATAQTAAIVLQIEREDLLDRLEEHFDLVTAMLAYVAAELDTLNRAGAGGDLAIDWR